MKVLVGLKRNAKAKRIKTYTKLAMFKNLEVIPIKRLPSSKYI